MVCSLSCPYDFLSQEIVCLTPEEDNVISEICFLAPEESPDLKYQRGHLLTSSKCPAVIITNVHVSVLGNIVYSSVTMAE